MTETGQWIDADGTPLALNIEWNVVDRFMPPIVFEEDGVPQQSGLRLRDTRHDARVFSLTLWIEAADEVSLRLQMRAMALAMNPKRGPGHIRFTTPVGDVRDIECTYQSGLGMLEKLGETSGLLSQKVTLFFKAHNPYWADPSFISSAYSINAVPNFFPIFPMHISTSQVVVDTTILNDGDLEAWPIIYIAGPGSVIKLSNLTTGLYTDFGPSSNMGAGQTLIIDTRPGFKTAKMADGLNVFSFLTTTSSLWPLVRGSNAIHLEMSGATAGVSQITFTYKRLFLTV